MIEVKQRHAEEINVWKKTFQRSVDSLTNDVRVSEADSVRMSVEWN